MSENISYLSHESNPHTQRIPCGYCGKSNVYTRPFLNRNLSLLNGSIYLCYRCGVDFVDKNEGWEEIQSKIVFNQVVL
jgi:hypothetical protein